MMLPLAELGSVVKLTPDGLGLNRMSAFVIAPLDTLKLNSVTASVPTSDKLVSVQIKQMRFTPGGELLSEVTLLSAPRTALSATLGALVHTANDACITSATLRLPEICAPLMLGFKFQTTGRLGHLIRTLGLASSGKNEVSGFALSSNAAIAASGTIIRTALPAPFM